MRPVNVWQRSSKTVEILWRVLEHPWSWQKQGGLKKWQWAALMMSRWVWSDDQQYWPATELIEETDDVDMTVSFNVNASLTCFLRLGYLKPFLARSKKTKQGPGFRVGALFISRCWFCLTVVAEPNLIQKDYKIIWCCVILCYGSLWMKYLCYVNDEVTDAYEMIMVE